MSHMFLLWLFLRFVTSAIPASAQNLEPAWQWSATAGIEWAVPVGGDRPSAILAATRDGKLHQFHIITGTPRFAEPIAIGKDVRFVSATADGAIVCNELEIIRVSIQSGPHTDRPAAKELWRTKIVGEELPASDGDPEFRGRLLAAIGVQSGVLAARSDGCIAELRRSDGTALWSMGVPAAAEIRLYSDTSMVLALHRGKKGIDATLIDRKAPNASPKTVDFAETWPMLAECTRDGLVAAWPNRVLLLTGGGELQRAALIVKWPIKAERVGVLQPVNQFSRPLLAILNAGGSLSLHDVATGETVWEKNERAMRNGRLEICGPHVLVLGDDGAMTAFHRDSPEPTARYPAREAEKRQAGFGDWQAVNVGNSIVVAACSGPRDSTSARNSTLDLLRTPLFRPGEWSSERAKATERVYSLGPAIGVRKVNWSPGRIIVTREGSIQVFVIPTE